MPERKQLISGTQHHRLHYLAKANQLLDSGVIDLAAFGASYIANPDLVERYRHGWPIAIPNQDLYYGGDEHGYTDYPTYSGTQR